MEENQCEFWERLTKDQEELREQMSLMMQILKRMARDKGIVEEDNTISTVPKTREAIKDLEYLSPVLNSSMLAP